MVGQLLGNRYELLEKIGGGGMAFVYKAKCHLLNRFVAVKILRQEFTNDQEFVKRFRIEAQSAASLSHPNIVSIYDVGQEDSTHYIIMEYIDGITLKEHITKQGCLKWKEAVEITIQICSAIEHAHHNRIIHRDIKPHNILMTKEGIPKVTDFGIARAVTSSTITMVGSTIGSVHYFSPEQARGGFTDEKSDLYSIGIELYEMVTGKLPFDGETPVAVALKHIQTDAKDPIEVNPSIPRGVNDIIMKAIKKDQNRRYQTASDMLQDLYYVLKEPKGGFIKENSDDNYPTMRFQAIGNDNYRMNTEQDPLIEEESGKKKNRKRGILLAVIVGMIIILTGSYVGYRIFVPPVNGNSANEIELKNYAGENFYDVKEQLEKSGLTVKENRVTHDKIPKDVIISQKPEAGKTLKKEGYNNTVDLEVSNGPKMIVLESYKNIDWRKVNDEITKLGLVVKIEEEFSETIGADLIIRTVPGVDESVMAGATVTIYKSKGPELKPTTVPNLMGKTFDEAKKLLSDAHLKLGVVSPEVGNNFGARVYAQEPFGDSVVNEETAVNLYFEKARNSSKVVTRTINLSDAQSYGDTIAVRIEIKPSDTNTTEVIMDTQKKKIDFPFTINIPVPDKGKTDVKIYFNKILVANFSEGS